MIGNTPGIGCVLVVFSATCLVAAAAGEKSATEPPAAEGKADDGKPGDAKPSPAGGCCGGPKLVPVCRRVPTTKKNPKTEYEVECELVCVPGCGKRLFGKAHSGCSGCSTDGAGCCGQPCCDHATIRTKKTLMKKVVDKEEDAWEYKVEWVCADCAAGGCCTSGCFTGDGRSWLGRSWHGFHEVCRGLLHRK